MVRCVEALIIQVGGLGGGQVGALAFGLFSRVRKDGRLHP
jgi:hypothetical protein